MSSSGSRLEGRVALITGASRGIGAAVARRFANEGATLILVARSKAGLEEVDDEIRAACGEDAAPTLVELDLAHVDHIDGLATAVAERFGKLDILVGNAALVGTLTPMHQIEPADWTQLMAVNLTANWRLIRAFDPPLRASDAGRAIFVTSGAAHGPHPYWGGYAITKAGLEMMVTSWAEEAENTNMRINLLDPGSTRTGMRAAVFPGEDPMTLKTPDDITGFFVDLAETSCQRHAERVQVI